MSWPSIITDLQTRGLSLSQIAAACNCGQATISDLKNKPDREPAYSLGQSLIRLSKVSNKELGRLKARATHAEQGA